ncbi:unnamed protein product [Gemmata massiliana]|uniref:Uncharacterized protein n=1 Tax=Gemmata massiliana TaxID=1210884 RepID=A0A6P2CUR5_9BACT|nr:unnamed protein product [Gemmata massiliana]
MPGNARRASAVSVTLLQALERATLDRAEQLRLELETEFADLVEEQRSLCARSNRPGTRPLRR